MPTSLIIMIIILAVGVIAGTISFKTSKRLSKEGKAAPRQEPIYGKKRIVSIALALCLCLALLPVSAVAASNPYPQYNWYNNSNDYQIACTWYAWQQVYNRLGIALPKWGNGGGWYDAAAAAGGNYSVGSAPEAGAIACWSASDTPPYGHVAYVTGVNPDGSFNITEGGSNWPGATSEGICNRKVSTGRYWPDKGFIYYRSFASIPNKPRVTVNGSAVTVSWNDVPDETSYNIYLVQAPWAWEDIKYSASVNANVTSYTFENVKAGAYNAFVIAMPNGAEAQSVWTEFSVANPEPSVSFSAWENSKYTYIRETDAAIGQQIDVSGGTCTKTGMILYDNNRKELGRAENPSYTDHRVFFKVNEELGVTLSPGTTYQYRFWAAVNGKIYYSDYKSFKTSGSANIAVTGISLNINSLPMKTGETASLTATVSPSNATNKTVTWNSNDTSVVTVDKNGVVTAIAAGSAKITAEAGGKTVTCTVTVAAVTVAVTSISLNKTALTLNSGETATLTATISPNNATDKNIIWTSDNEAVATVYNGVVAAVSAGTTIIRAHAGGKSASCNITVTGEVKECSFEIGAYVDGEYEINFGYYGVVDVYINGELVAPSVGMYLANLPAGTTYEIKNIVNNRNGYKYDGVYAGSLKGTVTSEAVNVVLRFSKDNSTSNHLYLDQVGVSMMVGGGTVILNPSNGTSFLAGHVVTWSSSDPSVATVSEGVVTPVSAGTAIITASYQGATATCTVTVRASKDLDNQDVPSSWAIAEVTKAFDAGLVPEVLQKNYTKPVSRADVAQMFINLLEQSSGKSVDNLMNEKGVSVNKDAFTDTSEYAVLAANALGIINGTGNSKFSPNGTFTRSQIAAIINRVARVLGVNTDGYTHSFTDVAGHWANSELGWPSSVGIINGVGDNKFSPDTELTTEQAIAITYRALKVLKSE